MSRFSLDDPLHAVKRVISSHKGPLRPNSRMGNKLFYLLVYLRCNSDQSINLFSQLCNNKNEYRQNNVKHSDGLPEKQIAHLS